MDEVFAYKLFMNAVQVANLALVWWLLGRLMPNRPRARLTAFVVFAWNPLMLFDAAGNAHNDALMVTLLLLGIVPLVFRERITNRHWLLGTFFVGMSALIKYTTGLVGLFYVVPWARRLDTWRNRIVWLGGTFAAIVGVTLVLYIPWLDFPRAFEPILTAASGKSWMYSNWAPICSP
jgi:4-amino-4-deoxy-L-arabinose transferase-like glycosyltransferase